MKPRLWSVVIATAICFFSGALIAQPKLPTKLTCEGELQNFPKNEKYNLKGIYIKIDDSTVAVGGSVGFDAAYKVSEQRDYIVFFVHPSDPLYRGSITRFSGELSLLNYEDLRENRLTTMLTAICSPAIPLF